MNALSVIIRTARQTVVWPIRHWRVIVVLALGLYAVYRATDYALLRQLETQRNEIKAAGLPLSFSDLKLTNIQFQENAATVYRYAAFLLYGAVREESPVMLRFMAEMTPACMQPKKTYTDAERKPLAPEDWSEAARQVALAAPALDAARKALPLPHCVFGNYDTPLAAACTPEKCALDAGHVKALTRAALQQALWFKHEGKPVEAWDTLALAMHMANGLIEDPSMELCLMRKGLFQKALETMEILLYEDSAPDPAVPRISAELAKCTDRASIRRPYDGERCFASAYANLILLENPSFIRPYVIHTEMRGNAITMGLAEIAGTADFSKRKALHQEFIRKTGGKHGPVLSFFTRDAELLDGLAANADRARIVLALKQFKQANGSYPESLAQLAPTYLSAVPQNACYGTDFVYRRDGEGFLIKMNRDNVHENDSTTKAFIDWCAAK